MKHFVLLYQGGPDYLERRAPFRAAHLEHARAAVARGELVLAGALGDPADGSLLLFQGADAEGARAFAAADPYVLHDVVQSWRVREWTTVVGALAVAPL